jgi:hypothetical protein
VIRDANNQSEYPARDGATHRQLSFEYRNLQDDTERGAFFKQHGVRWTEFARLKYFDIFEWTVVDPMDNLLLDMNRLAPVNIHLKKPSGLARTQ